MIASNKNPYSIAHIQKLRRIIMRLDLPRPPEFDRATDEQIQACYNGIGSDKFGWALKFTTDIMELFEPAACVHDFGWTYINFGVRADWSLTNDRFELGNSLLARNSFVWLGWLRSGIRAEREEIGKGLADVVRMDFAWKIYQSAAQPVGSNPLGETA